jgi:hypothetical protein
MSNHWQVLASERSEGPTAAVTDRWLLCACALLCCHCVESERYVGSIATKESAGGAAGAPVAGAAGSGGELPEFVPFSVPVRVDELAAPDKDQLDATLSPDLTEIFYRSEPRSAPGGGRSEIVTATRGSPDNPWNPPVLVAEIDAPEAWNLAPDLSLDGRTLWFSSDRSGGVGDLDLWVTTRGERGQPWGNLQNLTPLNSPEWDTDGGVSANQLLLIFSRRTGSAELLVTERSSISEPWSPPQPVSELNTPADEWDAALALDGKLLLYTSSHSERPDLDGALHIYEAQRSSIEDPFGPGRLVEELAAPGAIDEDPWLSNDGKVLVFTSTRDGRRHLYQSSR